MNIRTILNILSALLVILGVSMVFPSAIAYGYGENDLDGFLWSMLICFVFGVPVWLTTRKNRKLTNKDGFAIVTFTWITAALIGALPFYISGVIPNFTDAFFESMSGVTTTGASIIGSSVTLPNLPNGIESLPHATLFWRSFIQWIGGMGIIVFYIAILPLLGVGGVQLFKAEVPGPVADKIRPRVRETAKILWMVYLGITADDILAYDLPSDDLSSKDIQALNAELSDPRFADQWWQRQINDMLELGKKAEQQSLAKYGLDFVTDTYLPEKLAEILGR